MTQEQFFDRYKFNIRTDKIGGGSFGTVYKGYDTIRDQYVAIKVTEQLEVEDKVFSLHDELNALKNVSEHSNLALYEKVYTFESFHGVFDYGVMMYYPDGNLSQYLENNTNLDEKTKDEICLGILKGVGHLHKHQVVHRDLKPANVLILIRKDGTVVPKITDFSLGKQADTKGASSQFTNSFAGGTIQYSSPEQVKGLPLKLNTDIWSVGCIIYEVLSGKKLFDVEGFSSGTAEWQNKITERILGKGLEDALVIIPEKWYSVLSYALKRDTDDRAQSIDELLTVFQKKEQTQEIQEEKITKIRPKSNSVTDKTLVKETEEQQTQKEQYTQTRVNSSQKPATEKKENTSTTSFNVDADNGSNKSKNKSNTLKYILAAFGILVFASLGYFGWSYWETEKKKTTNQVQDLTPFMENGLYGYKKNGGIQIEPQFQLAGFFENGRALVQANDSSYYIDEVGNWSPAMVNDSINQEDQIETNKNEELVNWEKTKKENTTIAYQEYIEAYPDGVYVDEANTRINELKPKSNANTNRVPVRNNWRSLYDEVKELYHGIYIVVQNSKYGYVSQSGREIAPPIYDKVFGFEEGLGHFVLNNEHGYLNKQGKEINTVRFEEAFGFKNGLAIVKQYDKYGFIDKNGKFIIPLSYDDAYPFGYEEFGSANKNFAKVLRGKQWIWIDKSGICVKNCEDQEKIKQQQIDDWLREGNKAWTQDKISEAISLFTKAANAGNADAQNSLGSIFQYGHQGMSIDYQKALKWYQMSAKQKDPYGLYCLGVMYDIGYITKDEEKARNYFKESCELGYKDACRFLKD